MELQVQTPQRVTRLTSGKAGLAVLCVSASCATAQWDISTGVPGLNSEAYAMTTWDIDGPGPNPPRLVVAGNFTNAGGVSASRIAVWDGSSWSSIGSGVLFNNTINALAVFDEDGSGPNPPRLFAAGAFTSITQGGTPMAINRIAKWNGSAWVDVGPSGQGINGFVPVLYVSRVGGTPALYAGGNFSTAGGIACSSIARWNGSAWSPLGTGTNLGTYALVDYDDGTGNALYAGGIFTLAGGVATARIAKWNGSSWSALGAGLNGNCWALTTFDDGSGLKLYAGGAFTVAGGGNASRIARWNGTLWSNLPGGGGSNGVDNAVYALGSFNDNNQPQLYAGGDFLNAGGVAAARIAKWSPGVWTPLGAGCDDRVYALMRMTAGGPTSTGLYACGRFVNVNAGSANRMARWTGPGSQLPAARLLPDTVYEGFGYQPGSIMAGQAGGTGWAGPWTSNTGQWNVAAGSLPHFNGGDPMNHTIGRGEASTMSIIERPLDLGGGAPLGDRPGTLWLSFIAQQTGGSVGLTYLGVQLPVGPAGRFIFFGQPYAESTWGIDGGIGGGHRQSTVPATTKALLVMRIDFKTGPDDFRLWINPSLSIEPEDHTAAVTALNFVDIHSVTRAQVQLGRGAAAYSGEIDEIRIGNTFEDVTPFERIYACKKQVWSVVNRDVPPPRIAPAMTFVEARATSLAFGGWVGGTSYLNDTWEWDGSAWVQIPAAIRPSARALAGIATDTFRDRAVLFGGEGGVGVAGIRGDTWEFDALTATWTQMVAPGPAARSRHAMAFDSARGVTVLFGGWTGTGPLTDTWEWNGAGWVQVGLGGPAPTPRYSPAMAYDAHRRRVVLFGGQMAGGSSVLGDTWEWDGVVWSLVRTSGPPARTISAMAFDSKCNRVVLHGGYNGTQFLSDTWEWDGAEWVRAEDTPTAHGQSGMCYDNARNRMVYLNADLFSQPGMNSTETLERRCVCESEGIERGPAGMIAYPPNLEPGSLDEGLWIIDIQGRVSSLHPMLNTQLVTWLKDFPCDPAIGGDPPPPETDLPNCDADLAALGITGVSCDEFAETIRKWDEQILEEVRNEVDPFTPDSDAIVTYSYHNPPAYCPCPDQQYLFGGRDIVFVHGLRLDPLFERLVCSESTAPGAYTKWPDDISEFYPGGYWHEGAKRYWEDHIHEYMTSRGFRNRYIIVSYAATQRLDVAARAMMRQIADAMQYGDAAHGVYDPMGRYENNFGTPSYVVVSHSTGAPVTDITMSAASRFSNLNVGHVPELCKAHVSIQGAFGGSRLATAAIVLGGYLQTNPPTLPPWLCPAVNILLDLIDITGVGNNACRIDCDNLFDFLPLARSNLVDLVPVVMHYKWRSYQNTTPIKTLTLAGGHPTSLAPIKYLLLQGFDDNTVSFDSALSSANHPLLRPAGYRPQLDLPVLFGKVFDRGLFSPAGRGQPTKAIGLFIDQVRDKWFAPFPPIGLVVHPLLVGASATPYLSPSGMIQPVQREYKLTGGYNPRNRKPNHYSFLQSTADHFAGPNGDRDYNSSFGAACDEESWVVDDPAVFAHVPNTRYPFDNAPLIRPGFVGAGGDVPHSIQIRRARPLPHTRRWLQRLLQFFKYDWERHYILLEDWQSKNMYDIMYETVLTQRVNYCDQECGPPPPGCVGDFNNDGGFDGADVESFFEAWQNGIADADVNQDGGIDGSDVQVFFFAWENGSC
ncbi:MAG: hypothetical protein JNK25_13425 [Phycisphaerae bacterium]|nr:hypothetical protein [Phycisphaerae bacterium]